MIRWRVSFAFVLGLINGAQALWHYQSGRHALAAIVAITVVATLCCYVVSDAVRPRGT